MKRRTYNNFMKIYNRLIKEKHYLPDEASELTRRIFDNVEDDQKYGKRSAEWFYDLILDKNKFYINNILFYTYEEQEFENTVNCVLFARNNNNSITSYSNIKLYRCKIYENEELIRDLIPCYKKSNAEIGLYDLVNDVFYTNAGTDEFLKGDNI